MKRTHSLLKRPPPRLRGRRIITLNQCAYFTPFLEIHDENGDWHGFSYDGQGYTTLDVPGETDTFAYGIDGSNIVGFYDDENGDSHGFIYDGQDYTTLDAPGAYHTYVYGTDGSNIVGYYRDAYGKKHGFLATIPEPATLSLLTVGMLTACRRRRRCG